MINIKFLSALLITVSPTFAQWQLQNSGTSLDLNDVAILNQTTAIAVGNNGTILKTTNNGTDWTQINSGTTNHLNAVSFYEEQNGIAVGNEILCRTTDAGESWTNISLTEKFITISYREPFWGGPYILIGGENGIVSYSWNDGINWCDTVLFPFEQIIAVGFNYYTPHLNASLVHAATTTYTASTYSPCSGWDIFENPINFTWDILNGGEFYDNSYYLVGWSGNPGPVPLLLKKSLLDTTWHPTYSFVPPPYVPQDIVSNSKYNSNSLFVCGSEGKIFNSTDRGITWSEQYTYTSETLNAIAFAYDSIGYAVGENGSIVYTSNGGVSFIEGELAIASDFKPEQNYPNPFNPVTIIKFTIPQIHLPSGDERGGSVTLKVYDILGNVITTLVNEEISPGEYEV